MIVLPTIAVGQISFEDFENYTVGSLDSQLDTNIWSSIFTIPNIRTNAKITNDMAYSGTKCLSLVPDSTEYISIVGKLPLLNSGVAEVSFMQYVMLGYHNNYFSAFKTNYITQQYLYFLNNMNAHYDSAISALGYSGNHASFYYHLPIEEWVAHKYVLNFDTDTAYFYLNDSLYFAWDLNLNYNGVPSLKQWQAFTLSAPDSTDKAYYDDFRVVQYPTSTHQEQSLIEQFTVFPNPATHQVNFHLTLETHASVQFNILDVNGRIMKGWIEKDASFSSGSIDVSHLPNGIYFLQIMVHGQTETRKVVINR